MIQYSKGVKIYMKIGNFGRDGISISSSNATVQKILDFLFGFGGGIVLALIGVVILFITTSSIQDVMENSSYVDGSALVESCNNVDGEKKCNISYLIYGEYFYHEDVTELPDGVIDGSTFPIRYNPDNPREYVIEQTSFPWIPFIIGLLFLAGGGYIIVRNILILQKKKQTGFQSDLVDIHITSSPIKKNDITQNNGNNNNIQF